jgi:hypothetical protein
MLGGAVRRRAVRLWVSRCRVMRHMDFLPLRQPVLPLLWLRLPMPVGQAPALALG